MGKGYGLIGEEVNGLIGLKNNKGFTLVELLIIIGIIITLLSIAGYAYNAYMVRYNIEKEIKELYANLMTARMRALQQNQQYLIQFGTDSYTVYIDNDEDGQLDSPGDTPVDDLSRSGLSYEITIKEANIITFDHKGLAEVSNSIRVSRDNNAEYDCINVSRTRIKLGKWDGTDCINK